MTDDIETAILDAIRTLGAAATTRAVWRKVAEERGTLLFGAPLTPSIGALCCALDALEERGLVRSQYEPGGEARGGRPVRYLFIGAEARRPQR